MAARRIGVTRVTDVRDGAHPVCIEVSWPRCRLDVGTESLEIRWRSVGGRQAHRVGRVAIDRVVVVANPRTGGKSLGLVLVDGTTWPFLLKGRAARQALDRAGWTAAGVVPISRSDLLRRAG